MKILGIYFHQPVRMIVNNSMKSYHTVGNVGNDLKDVTIDVVEHGVILSHEKFKHSYFVSFNNIQYAPVEMVGLTEEQLKDQHVIADTTPGKPGPKPKSKEA